MGANFKSFFSYFNKDVEAKTSDPTLKIKPSHSSFQSFQATKHSSTRVQSSHQKARLERQAWDNVHCQGVGCGCTPWRPSGVPWSPPLLRGRRGTTCTAGVPWSPPLLRGRRGTTCTAKGSDVRPGDRHISCLLRQSTSIERGDSCFVVCLVFGCVLLVSVFGFVVFAFLLFAPLAGLWTA